VVQTVAPVGHRSGLEALSARSAVLGAAARVSQLIAELRTSVVVVLRGYDREQVEQYLARVSAALSQA